MATGFNEYAVTISELTEGRISPEEIAYTVLPDNRIDPVLSIKYGDFIAERLRLELDNPNLIVAQKSALYEAFKAANAMEYASTSLFNAETAGGFRPMPYDQEILRQALLIGDEALNMLPTAIATVEAENNMIAAGVTGVLSDPKALAQLP